jgi:hypothetical protein
MNHFLAMRMAMDGFGRENSFPTPNPKGTMKK